MRLFSTVIDLRDSVGDKSLPEFLARRRMPGSSWRTWDQIRYELADVSGEIVSDGSIRRWAKRYGIPESTDQAMSDEATQAYLTVIHEAGITIS